MFGVRPILHAQRPDPFGRPQTLYDLKLGHLWVVYPGKLRYPLTDRITALPLLEIHALQLDLGSP